ncbi:MAG: type II secretion system protein [Alphaproteobacteria bacterium]|nr:type II secretion system protein [Alphaproteobacteria bacterium]
MQYKNQSGRSMVEMLGVLAIIGVLSVSGIMGYSYGMDKYRANQTVNDVMMRAIDVITYADRGVDPNTVGWPEKNPVGYPASFVLDENNVYSVQVQNIPSRVCQMVGDALKTTAEVYVDSVDLANAIEDPCETSDDNTMTFYFEASSNANNVSECQTDADCGENKYCDMGLCFVGWSPEITARVFGGSCTKDSDCNTDWVGSCSYCDTNLGYCVEKSDMNNASCTLSDETVGKCSAGECLSTGCTYEKNKCEGKTYCASPNNSCNKAFLNDETGMCVTANASFSQISINGVIYYVSKGPISWWDGDAGCRALGFDGLISLSDIFSDWNGSDYSCDYIKGLEWTDFGNALSGKTHVEIWTSNVEDECQAYRLNIGHFVYGGCDVVKQDRNQRGYSFAICKR